MTSNLDMTVISVCVVHQITHRLQLAATASKLLLRTLHLSGNEIWRLTACLKV